MFVFARLVDIVCMCEECGGRFQARSIVFTRDMPLVYLQEEDTWIGAQAGSAYSVNKGSFVTVVSPYAYMFPVAGGELYAPEEYMAPFISRSEMKAVHSSMVN